MMAARSVLAATLLVLLSAGCEADTAKDPGKFACTYAEVDVATGQVMRWEHAWECPPGELGVLSGTLGCRNADEGAAGAAGCASRDTWNGACLEDDVCPRGRCDVSPGQPEYACDCGAVCATGRCVVVPEGDAGEELVRCFD